MPKEVSQRRESVQLIEHAEDWEAVMEFGRWVCQEDMADILGSSAGLQA